jgi:hypothetical protein
MVVLRSLRFVGAKDEIGVKKRSRVSGFIPRAIPPFFDCHRAAASVFVIAGLVQAHPGNLDNEPGARPRRRNSKKSPRGEPEGDAWRINQTSSG